MFNRSGYSKFETESEHGDGYLPAIQFLGVGRMNDYPPVLLATYSHHSKTDLGFYLFPSLPSHSASGHRNCSECDQ
jgi:hypothetical protein